MNGLLTLVILMKIHYPLWEKSRFKLLELALTQQNVKKTSR